MNGTHNLKRIIAGALLSGGIAVAGLGLAAGTAQAQPGFAPLATWCPGQPVPGYPPVVWDINVCHDYYETTNTPDHLTHVVEGEFTPPNGPLPLWVP
jgi:hypothetical protein